MTDEARLWLRMVVALAMESALAPSTAKQYAGAEVHFIKFALYLYGGEDFLPASNRLMCEFMAWKSTTVDPKNLKSSLSAVRHLH